MKELVFEIVPMVGVGPVRFGMPREQCRKSLGLDFDTFFKGTPKGHPTDAFDSLGMHVYYSGIVPVVEFIELSFSKEATNAIFTIDGVDVFQTNAAKLVGILVTKSEWRDDVGSLVFPAIEMALYREHPFDPEFDDFDRWDAVSVGRTGYFKKRRPKSKTDS